MSSSFWITIFAVPYNVKRLFIYCWIKKLQLGNFISIELSDDFLYLKCFFNVTIFFDILWLALCCCFWHVKRLYPLCLTCILCKTFSIHNFNFIWVAWHMSENFVFYSSTQFIHWSFPMVAIIVVPVTIVTTIRTCHSWKHMFRTKLACTYMKHNWKR